MSGGEFDRIARLSKVFGEAVSPDLGIGDDAAVLHPHGALVATVDAAVEEVHFRRDLLTLEEASSRAVEAAASDIAAMGGTLTGPGCGLLLAWSLPRDLSERDFDALLAGARRAADRLSTRVIGGNLAAAPTIVLTTTALGRCGRRAVLRSGARPGDIVAVSGPIGAAAIGLRVLMARRGAEPWAREIVQAWRAPVARLDLSNEIARGATAAIDISDGLAQDVSHVARASSCAITLRAEAIPMLREQHRAARELGLDAIEMALHGGEDYEVLVTAPRGTLSDAWCEIGEVAEGAGVSVSRGGITQTLDATGWDHFRG